METHSCESSFVVIIKAEDGGTISEIDGGATSPFSQPCSCVDVSEENERIALENLQHMRR
jgi:hypothetical protein